MKYNFLAYTSIDSQWMAVEHVNGLSIINRL